MLLPWLALATQRPLQRTGVQTHLRVVRPLHLCRRQSRARSRLIGEPFGRASLRCVPPLNSVLFCNSGMPPSQVDCKIVLLGATNVGKTCLVQRFVNGRFDDGQSATVGAAFAATNIKATKGMTISVGIWDTAGAERFQAMTRIYYKGAAVGIVCYGERAFSGCLRCEQRIPLA